MTRTRTTNRGRRRRNRRNRQSANQNRAPVVFEPDTKYQFSKHNADGVFILSRRKRALPTTEELEAKKQKKVQIKTKQIARSNLSHKVIALYEHGCYMPPDFQFGPKKPSKIIAFLQAKYEKYRNKACAASFLFRALARHKKNAESPHLEAHRDCRGENRNSPKRKNEEIISICDEMLSEKKATSTKVLAALNRAGHRCSRSTIYRIAKDLMFKWTKPWYTDVLTSAQKYKRNLFVKWLLGKTSEELLQLLALWLFTDEKWFDIVGPECSDYVKAATKKEAKLGNQVCFFSCVDFTLFVTDLCCFLQAPRHKSKKGGVKKRVYFWAGICWHAKTRGIAWTASDNQVIFRHTKNLCVGTLFEDKDWDGNGTPMVCRVTETRSGGDDDHVYYVPHFEFPDADPPFEEWEHSAFDEVQGWHRDTRDDLRQRPELQPPSGMQDTAKTIEIYEDALYPCLREYGLDSIVEDNASPHNNATIRECHRRHGVNIVGYRATPSEKEDIRALIREQVRHYRREQDQRAQMTKQTRELERLPAWPPNSPDLNLIEVVWSWMVKWMRRHEDGWPRDPETLKQRVLEAWDAVSLDSFRNLVRAYRLRLLAIHSVEGGRHPDFA